MGVFGALKRLWQHEPFRRLLILRTLSQAADGTLQVGMASYILFSPQSQPNAWAIAGVLALTLLPFTVIGPFVSPLLDRWPRRNIALYSDVLRAALAVVIGLVVFSGRTSGVWAVVLFGALLVALSVNRFMLAGLSAALEHTVDGDEYLTASSILPTVGPLGVVIGAGLGFGTRLAFGGVLEAHQADAIVFGLAALLFVGSVLTAKGFAPHALGPDGAAPASSFRGIVAGLAEAAAHLRTRQPAVLGLVLMAATRLLFGLITVVVILAARNLWHAVDQPVAAMGDITLWGLATGAGFILSAPVVPAMVRPLGLRRTAIALLALGAVASVAMALSPTKPVIFVASFFIGISVQAFKICVDTLVQAHVDEEFKGRAFTFYDMAFNSALVLAGVVAALTLPPTGLSVLGFVAMAALYAACAVAMAVVSARIGRDTLEKGTEDLVAR